MKYFKCGMQHAWRGVTLRGTLKPGKVSSTLSVQNNLSVSMWGLITLGKHHDVV